MRRRRSGDPEPGVTLTPEEAALAAEACRHDVQWDKAGHLRDDALRALAARLEAAS